MAAIALTPLQTQVLGLLTDSKAARNHPLHVLATIHVSLYKRAGLSDEDTIFYLGRMIEQGVLRPEELTENLRILIGY